MQTVIPLAEEVRVEATLYRFLAPHSYTGQTVVEIHLRSNQVLNALLYRHLLDRGLRAAGPGEFTARAYLNGKLDLMQAEAVNEIISGTNTYQLAAAQRLLGGQLGAKNRSLQADVMDLLSHIEAGMDFSEEDIEFISPAEIENRLTSLKQKVDALLEQGARIETLLHLPSVGLTGVPNSGKSSLFNALLKSRRSIVSDTEKTTRDVLAQPLALPRHECVLFDTAGLLANPQEIIDVLAQRAALQSLRTCQRVLCCIDLSKEGWQEDRKAFAFLPPASVLPVGTKADLLDASTMIQRRDDLSRMLCQEVLIVSTQHPESLQRLTEAIDDSLTRRVATVPEGMTDHADASMLTSRQREGLESLRKNLDQAMAAARAGELEIVAMVLRDVCLCLSHIEHHLDEEILTRIFSRFCIGK